MARSRPTRPPGNEPMIRRRARDGVILGRTPAEIASSIKSAMPTANLNTIKRIVRQESGRQQRVDALLNAPGNLEILNAGLLGCGPKTKELRIRLTVTVWDRRTERLKPFGTTIQTGTGQRVDELINSLIKEVENQAVNNGYGQLGVHYEDRTGPDPHYTIDYIDCI